MLFSSITFLYYFLPCVLLLYFISPKQIKNVVLLSASLFFYWWGEPKYTILMVFTILLGYLHGILIDKFKGKTASTFFLVSSVTTSIALLGFFKYADFFVKNTNAAFGTSTPLLKVALPIGISFYTFQTLSYTIDVYLENARVQKNLINLATYVVLFPQLIAGPIVRYTTVEEELNNRTHSFENFAYGVNRFILGLAKKVLLANALGELCENMLSSKYREDFDKYTLDQFPFRDTFRELKAVTQFSVFHQKDNNGIYITENSVSKIEYPLKENSVINAADKFQDLYDTYCLGKDMAVYYSIIPDKNYFTAKSNGYPSMDYERLVSLLKENLDSIKYIDIFACLSVEDYYSTDTHWRQEKLIDAVERIAKEMGFLERLADNYVLNKFSSFYGVYYGQAALPIAADTIYYLTNDVIDGCTVYNYETEKYSDIYDVRKGDSDDPYELFLSGAVPLLTIENPKAKTDKELIIFRDSFGSSIAPLFVEAYSKITLIDIRYITSDYLENFITFDQQDVLFLYSTLVINNSTMLK